MESFHKNCSLEDLLKPPRLSEFGQRRLISGNVLPGFFAARMVLGTVDNSRLNVRILLEFYLTG